MVEPRRRNLDDLREKRESELEHSLIVVAGIFALVYLLQEKLIGPEIGVPGIFVLLGIRPARRAIRKAKDKAKAKEAEKA